MKRIDISPHKQSFSPFHYSIFLSSTKKWTFNNKRKADRFSMTLSKYFTNRVISINFLYKDLWNTYREMWMTLTIQEEQEIKILLERIVYKFDKMFHLPKNENYGYQIWAFLQCLVNTIEETSILLETKANSRKWVTLVWTLKRIKESIGSERQNLQWFKRIQMKNVIEEEVTLGIQNAS